jgi:hypothetical protein
LAGANLQGDDLTGANLASVNLAGAKLDRTSLTHAIFTGADLSRASLFDAVAPLASSRPPLMRRILPARTSRVPESSLAFVEQICAGRTYQALTWVPSETSSRCRSRRIFLPLC